MHTGWILAALCGIASLILTGVLAFGEDKKKKGPAFFLVIVLTLGAIVSAGLYGALIQIGKPASASYMQNGAIYNVYSQFYCKEGYIVNVKNRLNGELMTFKLNEEAPEPSFVYYNKTVSGFSVDFFEKVTLDDDKLPDTPESVPASSETK